MKIKKGTNYLNTLDFRVCISLFAVSILPLIIYITYSVVNSQRAIGNQLELETSKMKIAIKRDLGIFDIEASKLSSIVTDYSIWTETYTSVVKKDYDWIKDNFSEVLPKQYGVDIVLVANKNKEIIDSYGINEEGYLELWKDSSVSKILDHNFNKETIDNIKGFKRIGESMYVIAISPILKDDYEGSVKGIVILGKKITPEFLINIENQFGYTSFIFQKDMLIAKPELKDAAYDYLTKFSNNKNVLITGNYETVVGTIPVTDISGETIGALYNVKSIGESLGAFRLLYRNVLFFSGVWIVIIAILIFYLRRKIVFPIIDFKNQISNMAENSTLTSVSVKGMREIAELAETFNNMTRIIEKNKEENESLRVSSITDSLTNLYNQGYFYECFNNKIAAGAKNLAVLFCDIDRFKMINDSQGHVIGDYVLNETSNIIIKIAGRVGTLFRYGGEEFAVLLENTSEEEAYEIAEAIRIGVEKSEEIQKYADVFPITICIGLAFYPHQAVHIKELIEKADIAMYYGKQNGRNKCYIYSDEIAKAMDQDPIEIVKKEMVENAVNSIAAAINVKDSYTEEHSESVAKYALILAEELGLADDKRDILRIGGMLHDCGKIGIPDQIINKEGPLDQEEWDIIRNHTMIGRNIIKYIIETPNIDYCIRYHHERWDGRGYPEGLSGESIPLYARIISIADAYHAMTSDRPYRKALNQDEAFEELRKNKYVQFDGKLVDAFISAVSKAGVKESL